jgi:hypothetical protein
MSGSAGKVQIINGRKKRVILSCRVHHAGKRRNICTQADIVVGYYPEMQMKVINATHREENGHTIVSLNFKTRDQLMDPDDPSPLQKKELTQVAEDAILSTVYEVGLKKPVTLEIEIPGVPDPGPVTEISDAIRHHFRFVLTEHERETGIFLRERHVSLAFTGINLLIALFYIVLVYENEVWMSSIAGIFLTAVIVIMNWATIWDTYEFFIFDGREKKNRKKLLEKIIHGEIRVIPSLSKNTGIITQ